MDIELGADPLACRQVGQLPLDFELFGRNYTP